MSWKSDKITIVGGGSAGWMTAATLIKFFPHKQITVIESATVPTVGVGESTLGQIRGWMHALDIEPEQFMKATDASFKLSIKFIDFYKSGAGGFHYPFGRPFLPKQTQIFGLSDWSLKKALHPETQVQDYCRTFFPAMSLVDRNRFSRNTDGQLDNFDCDKNVAFHFDATKFGAWLRDKYCLPKGVQHIIADVKDVQLGDQGIHHLTFGDGQKVAADLYIDCTGWKSLLLGSALKEPFISYQDILPNNRAWATQVPYVDKKSELEPFTSCTAISNGWVWNIPLWSRIGTGYVYSDKYISKAAALEEFKTYLRKRMVIADAQRVEHLDFKDIAMRIGIHQRTWVKNVLAIGLSAGFIEPLESNGLFTVHEFLLKAVRSLGRESFTQWDIDTYNLAANTIFNNFAEFVALHYALSIRDDSEYWQDISRKSFRSQTIEKLLATTHGFADLSNRKMFLDRHEEHMGIHCIATGMNYYVADPSLLAHLRYQHPHIDYEDVINSLDKKWKKQQLKWRRAADKAPTLYQYLNRNIYKNS